jgi:hypothetical protein
MSLRARVEQLPRYYECSYDGMKPAPSGEWVKLADVLALLPPETAETPRIAHSKSEYKRLKTMGANVLCPHNFDLTRVICPHGCLTHK